MNLRERIENNLAIWLFGAVGTGFIAGLGAYNSIIEIAQLDVIPKSRLEELEAGCKAEAIDLDPSVPSGQPDQEKLQAHPNQSKTSVASRGQLEELSRKLDGSTAVDNSETSKIRFSEILPPFPDGLDLIRPGMKLSETRSAFPNGELSSGWYAITIEKGPFNDVTFYSTSRGEDPTIKFIVFTYRSAEAKQSVVSETLRRYGGINHSSESLGAVLTWPDINGFKLELKDDYYQISPREEVKGDAAEQGAAQDG